MSDLNILNLTFELRINYNEIKKSEKFISFLNGGNLWLGKPKHRTIKKLNFVLFDIKVLNNNCIQI